MTDKIVMQHATKGPAGFSHGDFSADSDDEGFISVPAHLTGHAQAHGFSAFVGQKPVRPLTKGDDAKGLKGGAKKADESESDDTDVKEPELEADKEKPEKGAKGLKGGAK